MWDILLRDCHVATMAGDVPYGAVRDAAVGIEGGRIAWIGPAKSCPQLDAHVVRTLSGCWITPGLIDCHTHIIFAGDRAHEWEMRQKGASYEEIAAAGGGILSTVENTRKASEDALFAATARRVKSMLLQGITTIEIKSGYGLDLDSEIKLLRVAARVAKEHEVRVAPTFLGAHAVPPEFRKDRESYLELICGDMIPAIARAGLAESVDAFCETIGFTREETERVFKAACAHGLRVKLHADQLSDQGGAILAAKYKALSADHLEYVSAAGLKAMAAAGTVAVLLPCAFYFLKETKKPPIRALRELNVAMAVATDCNPGTSPATSPLLAMSMASTLFDLTPEEALLGMTRHAARALGKENAIGTLQAGMSADLAVWEISEPAELSYWMGADLLRDRYFAGRSDNEDFP
jgi:imidazolonepropionase